MRIPTRRKLTREEKAIIERLRQSASRPLSREELANQRVSWAFGNLPRRSTLTRDEVVQFLKSGVGE